MKHCDAGENLAKCGLRNTVQRKTVLEILERSDEPLAVEQIYTEVKNRGVAANLSTVYRILEALSGKNIASKLSIPGDPRAFFEYNRALHRHYLICLGCRKILSLERCPLGDYEQALERETDYAISGHKLVVYGYCPACRTAQDKPQNAAPHN
jgi:Fur family ferric uptake transcriptional regulator